MDNQYLPDDLIKMIMDINTKEIKEEKNNKKIHKYKYQCVLRQIYQMVEFNETPAFEGASFISGLDAYITWQIWSIEKRKENDYFIIKIDGIIDEEGNEEPPYTRDYRKRYKTIEDMNNDNNAIIYDYPLSTALCSCFP
jgi:hypothetical protein